MNAVRYCVYDDLPKKAYKGEIAIISCSLREYLYTGDKWVEMGKINDSYADNTVRDIEGTNCPNCGAPIDKSLDKCPYCSTPYIWR